MLKKVVGLVGLAGMLALVAGAGCSSSTPAATDGGAGAASDTGAPLPSPDAARPKPDAAGGDGGGGGSCYSESEILPTLQGTAPVKGAGKCTDKEIADYYAACLDSKSTEAGCTAFEKSNPVCSRCIWPPLDGDDPKNLPVGAIIIIGEDADGVYPYPNQYACAAHAINKPECALKMSVQDVCLSSACFLCEEDAAYEACTTEASTKACKPVFDAACTKAVDDGYKDWEGPCDAKDYVGIYTKVAKYLCGGAAPTDAGGGG